MKAALQDPGLRFDPILSMKATNMSSNLVRIIVQLVLAGPVMLLLLMSVIFSGAWLFSLGSGDGSGTAMAVIIVPVGLAIAALLASIVLPMATIFKRRWLLWSLRLFMGLGILLAGLFWLMGLGSELGSRDALEFGWMGGGSIAVAVWNLYRMHIHAKQVGHEVVSNG